MKFIREILFYTYESAGLAFGAEKHMGALPWILFVRNHVQFIAGAHWRLGVYSQLLWIFVLALPLERMKGRQTSSRPDNA